MEIHAEAGDRHNVLFYEGEIPRRDNEFLQEHRELPDRVRKSSNPEFSHTLILVIQFGWSIMIIIFFIGGCNVLDDDYDEKITGSWVISELHMNHAENDIMINFIDFHANGICITPKFEVGGNDSTRWSFRINNEEVVLIIDGKNNLFSGEYVASFWSRDDSQYMKLKSKNNEMICAKFTIF